MKRRSTDNPDLSKSGISWDVALRWTGTTTKKQLAKFAAWLGAVLAAGVGTGLKLEDILNWFKDK